MTFKELLILAKEQGKEDIMSFLGENVGKLDYRELLTVAKNLAWYLSSSKIKDRDVIDYIYTFESQLFYDGEEPTEEDEIEYIKLTRWSEKNWYAFIIDEKANKFVIETYEEAVKRYWEAKKKEGTVVDLIFSPSDDDHLFEENIIICSK